MRITLCLQRQHIGFMFKKHWQAQGKRVVLDTGVEAVLAKKGIEQIKDASEYLKAIKMEKRKTPKFVLDDDIFQTPVPLDENHPDFQDRGLYLIGDNNVLVEHMPQTQVLLNTLVIEGLPERVSKAFEKTKLPADLERSMQQSVLVSHLLDAEQQKLAPIKDPLKPMRGLPRPYGITDARKNMLMSTRLLNHCERFFGHTLAADRKILNDSFFVTPFKKDDSHVQIEVTAETFMTSRKPISPFEVSTEEQQQELPDIFPLKEVVSIPEVHFYNERSVYPIRKTSEFSHPHTIMLHYSQHEVKNLFETQVTPEQMESRALLKGFAVAASRAHSLYGKDTKVLNKPIVVQVIQLDGSQIQFGIFQLNTLDLNNKTGIKNYWFRQPITSIYETCHYNQGRPALVNYNFDILRFMSAFYNN